ncbi:transmembrane and ubiquitin-like domain-containing protein 2 isoform X1 [Trichogramma pretiosum]|uniref:transmembrane and ubiquitin-like domain-containing protein 2 isoform X1 n=2 Tax=Trichogramma pretiosum TaxID=7493 RepID=UPI0006C979E6|nr:transmembrane and ubiquitin-like domain-containing protein 2 isoform X1 [Trichogramma pretiosum]
MRQVLSTTRMTLIEGVGDEVLDFFIVVGVLLIGWFAWCSTNISDQPIIRTVLILQARTRTRFHALRANQQQARTEATVQHQNTSNTENETTQVHSANDADASNMDNSSRDVTSESPQTEQAANEQDIIRAMDSYTNDRNHENLDKKEEKPVDEKEKESSPPKETVEPTKEEEIDNSQDKISIKLKFINDDQKLVTADLKELLGDFKKRHFQVELDSRKLVRLVFNGHVLQPDSITLQQCGFFNNCVVHCLIHTPRPPTTDSIPNTANNNASNNLYFNPSTIFHDIPANGDLESVQIEWDLSRVLVTCIFLILSAAWFFRYHYAQLFTISSTVGLFGLTVIFTASLFRNLYADQETLQHIN